MIIAWIIAAMTVVYVVLMSRKIWWGPIFGLAYKAALVGLVLTTKEVFPILVSAAISAVVLACAIPQWYRDRHGPYGDRR